MMIIAVLIAVLIIFFAVWYYKSYILRLSFKEAIGKIGLPIVSFEQDNKTFNFLIDSGADYSALNSTTLDQLNYIELKGAKPMYGIDGNAIPTTRVGVKLFSQNCQFVEAFQVTNIAGLDKLNNDYNFNIVGILGNSFLVKYKFLIDFKNLRVSTSDGRRLRWYI